GERAGLHDHAARDRRARLRRGAGRAHRRFPVLPVAHGPGRAALPDLDVAVHGGHGGQRLPVLPPGSVVGPRLRRAGRRDGAHPEPLRRRPALRQLVRDRPRPARAGAVRLRPVPVRRAAPARPPGQQRRSDGLLRLRRAVLRGPRRRRAAAVGRSGDAAVRGAAGGAGAAAAVGPRPSARRGGRHRPQPGLRLRVLLGALPHRLPAAGGLVRPDVGGDDAGAVHGRRHRLQGAVRRDAREDLPGPQRVRRPPAGRREQPAPRRRL
ncbi:MAG: Bacteriorhodopsin-like protein, partial [uncultured Frankineae bacterium]